MINVTDIYQISVKLISTCTADV